MVTQDGAKRRTKKAAARRILVLDPASGRVRQPRGVPLVLNAVNERAFSLAVMESEGRILQRIARGGPLELLLTELVLAIERLSREMLGSVLLLADDGTYARQAAAPSLPPRFRNAIDGLRVGPNGGHCGRAMYSGKAVIVSDIARDPRWSPYRDLALESGLRACWSTPILSSGGQVLGVFALYYLRPRSPRPREKRLVQLACDLASIAIESDAARRRPRGGAAKDRRADERNLRLSQREMQVLRQIAQGQAVKRIASGLHVTVSTVYTHRARIFEKLGVGSNVELTRYAVTHRLVS